MVVWGEGVRAHPLDSCVGRHDELLSIFGVCFQNADDNCVRDGGRWTIFYCLPNFGAWYFG